MIFYSFQIGTFKMNESCQLEINFNVNKFELVILMFVDKIEQTLIFCAIMNKKSNGKIEIIEVVISLLPASFLDLPYTDV